MPRIKPAFILASIAMYMLSAGESGSLVKPAMGETQADVFEQVHRTVDHDFLAPDFKGIDWQALREKHKPRADSAQSSLERASVINEMLAALQTSHTRLYVPGEPAYHQLLGIFLTGNDELRRKLKEVRSDVSPHYSGIGIFTEMRDGKTFLSAILDGSPASEAGLLVGDQLLEADGQPFHLATSFAGKAGQPVELLIQRTPDTDSRMRVSIEPKMLDGATMFLDAMNASTRIIERNGRQVGYLHIWSYAGQEYQRALEQTLLFGPLKDTDALVLDLREGWGGASPVYLNLFTSRTIGVTATGRDGNRFTFRSGWQKPVVLLVNGKTRSGKELLAYGFRRYGFGPVVGSTTAGAVVQGRLSAMDDGSLLYLAVGDVQLDDGLRLEGLGVTPDIEVPFALAYAEGADPQKDRAVEVALELAKQL